VKYIKGNFPTLLGGTKENHKNINSLSPDRYSNPGPPDYEENTITNAP
jgi:hypothetical protein